MKAAVMHGPGDIRYEEVEIPKYDADGMLLKVVSVGLCGSDVRNLTTDSRKGQYPHIYGHEVVGIVDQVGANVTKYKKGDRLFVHPGVQCLKCENCMQGNGHICENFKLYDKTQGGFAEYLHIPKWGVEGRTIHVIPDNFDLDKAVLAEPLSSVFSCQRNIDVKIGDTVLIIGAGPIGCLQSELAKLRGAKQVIMIDINEDRLKQAKVFGVDHIIDSSKENALDLVMQYTNGKGAEKVISANPSTKAQSEAIYMTRKCGILAFFGGVAKGALTEIDSNYIHYNGLWIYGHYAASTMDIKDAFDLIISGKIDAAKYITHKLPLSEINQAIHLTKTGAAIKVICKP